MPKGVQYFPEHLEMLRSEMSAMRFTEITYRDLNPNVYKNFESKRREREIGFKYISEKGLVVIAWSTFSSKTGGTLKKDLAWVVTLQNDEEFHNPSIKRTGNFINNFLFRAKKEKTRVDSQPKCTDPNCNWHMSIMKRRYVKGSRFWKCLNPIHFWKGPTKSWDTGLPKEMMEITNKKRKQRKKYREVREAQGKPHSVAGSMRKPWLEKTKEDQNKNHSQS